MNPILQKEACQEVRVYISMYIVFVPVKMDFNPTRSLLDGSPGRGEEERGGVGERENGGEGSVGEGECGRWSGEWDVRVVARSVGEWVRGWWRGEVKEWRGRWYGEGVWGKGVVTGSVGEREGSREKGGREGVGERECGGEVLGRGGEG
ncbi:hypothetical protein ACJJTC_013231 [Scirpophaga incertulas]